MKYKLQCKFCNRIFTVPYKSYAVRQKYCSLSCAGKTLKGPKSPRWKGGRIKDKSGYIRIYAPHHPFAMNCGGRKYILEHRLIMEKTIDRYLKRFELVHHKNGIKSDNRPENLELVTPKEHKFRHPNDMSIARKYRWKGYKKLSEKELKEKQRFRCRKWYQQNREYSINRNRKWRKKNHSKWKIYYTAYNLRKRLSK